MIDDEDLHRHISKWLHPSNGEAIFGPQSEYEVHWEYDPLDAVQEMPETIRPSFPRVVPPTRKDKVPMAHDGGPGLRDGKHASRIRYLLREWL